MALTSFVDYSLEDIKDVENKSTKKEKTVEKRSYSVEALVETSKMIHYMTNKGVSEDFDLYSSSLEHLNDYIIHRGKDGYAGFNQSEARLMNIARHYTAGALGMEVNPKSAGSLESDTNEIIQYSVEEASSENTGFFAKIVSWLKNLVEKSKSFISKMADHFVSNGERKVEMVNKEIADAEESPAGQFVQEKKPGWFKVATASVINSVAKTTQNIKDFVNKEGKFETERGNLDKEVKNIIKDSGEGLFEAIINDHEMGTGVRDTLVRIFKGKELDNETKEKVHQAIIDKLWGGEIGFKNWAMINTVDGCATYVDVQQAVDKAIDSISNFEFSKKLEGILSDFKNFIRKNDGNIEFHTDSDKNIDEQKTINDLLSSMDTIINGIGTLIPPLNIKQINSAVEKNVKDRLKDKYDIGHVYSLPDSSYVLYGTNTKIFSGKNLTDDQIIDNKLSIINYTFISLDKFIKDSIILDSGLVDESKIKKHTSDKLMGVGERNLKAGGTGVIGGSLAFLLTEAVTMGAASIIAAGTYLIGSNRDIKFDIKNMGTLFGGEGQNFFASLKTSAAALEDIVKKGNKMMVKTKEENFDPILDTIIEAGKKVEEYARLFKGSKENNRKIAEKISTLLKRFAEAVRESISSWISTKNSVISVINKWVNINAGFIAKQARLIPGKRGEEIIQKAEKMTEATIS